MKSKYLGLALAAVVLSAPVFAQTGDPTAGAGADVNANTGATMGAGSSSYGVSSGGGIGVTSGTGIAVQPAANASVTVTPSTSVAIPSAHLMPGGVMAPAGSTTTLGGPSGDISGSQTVTTRYWVNVPAGAERDPTFQRWQSLR
jgi:hypothetical protein